MTKSDKQIFNQIPRPDSNVSFQLIKVEDVCLPHPYFITPKHLEYADSMVLNEQTIARAEQKCTQCDICRKLCRQDKQPQTLTYAEHQTQKTLFIEVADNHDLNAVPGLHPYLLGIKEMAQRLGIQGFAFPMGKVKNGC